MSDQVKRIAMWSGPRNISTAMMRSFENRPDTQVIDEPFYAHYLRSTGLDHPGRDEVLAHQNDDPYEVVKTLLGPLEEGNTIFYQKHMSHHLLVGMDQSWLPKMTHAFLIRDPVQTLASYVKTREEVSLSDIGLPQQLALFDFIADKFGTPPPVLDSKDLLKNPEAKLTLLCSALGIEFHPNMLSWPTGPRGTDGVWAPWWYQDVIVSSGFESYREIRPELDDKLLGIVDLAQPYYEKLSRYKI